MHKPDASPRLSIKRDPNPDIRVQTGECFSWPVRMSIRLPIHGEVVLSWVVPARTALSVFSGRQEAA